MTVGYLLLVFIAVISCVWLQTTLMSSATNLYINDRIANVCCHLLDIFVTKTEIANKHIKIGTFVSLINNMNGFMFQTINKYWFFFVVAPQWVMEPQDVATLAGGTLIVHCQAEGFPQPQITWMRGRGKNIRTNTSYDAATREWAGWLRSQLSIPGRGKIFFSSP
jgi:hypothetical protein